MKKLFLLLMITGLITACGPGKSSERTADAEEPYETGHSSSVNDNDGKGFGPVKTVSLTSPLDQEMIGRGKAIYEMKCQACHRLDDKRVVGPGWKGVTKTRKPEWIMNMITNVDEMLEKDAEAQKLLELCLTRMPNQNVTVPDARDILEFMRQNDGEQ